MIEKIERIDRVAFTVYGYAVVRINMAGGQESRRSLTRQVDTFDEALEHIGKAIQKARGVVHATISLDVWAGGRLRSTILVQLGDGQDYKGRRLRPPVDLTEGAV